MMYRSHFKPQYSLKKEGLIVYPDIWTNKIVQTTTSASTYSKLDFQKAIKKELRYKNNWYSLAFIKE